jgi:DNA-binding NarL/FixJ family response regulator
MELGQYSYGDPDDDVKENSMAQTAVRHARLLAVDDSPEFLASFESLFAGSSSFELIGKAGSGHEALTLLSELHPDVVLMDLQMAGMNGLETMLEIHRRFPEIAVVIITAHDFPWLRDICHQTGACDFVPKSRLDKELPSVLARLLPFQRC